MGQSFVVRAQGRLQVKSLGPPRRSRRRCLCFSLFMSPCNCLTLTWLPTHLRMCRAEGALTFSHSCRAEEAAASSQSFQDPSPVLSSGPRNGQAWLSLTRDTTPRPVAEGHFLSHGDLLMLCPVFFCVCPCSVTSSCWSGVLTDSPAACRNLHLATWALSKMQRMLVGLLIIPCHLCALFSCLAVAVGGWGWGHSVSSMASHS